MAKVLFSYTATTIDELSLKQNEKVEVLDDSKQWWMVKNKMGAKGYVPSNLLEMVQPKVTSRGENEPIAGPGPWGLFNTLTIVNISEASGSGGLINLSGKLIPAPPIAAPPPPPPPPTSGLVDREVNKLKNNSDGIVVLLWLIYLLFVNIAFFH